ncbi:hypothetical protein [Salinibaculum rarum]|uniref:hypothetical protein n=1 Tax=Salinibaculum rarum TaxID=3058903 RepID=UPI00265D908A|nr:hypothetical protein [Salinibaculum sp. KK48]
MTDDATDTEPVDPIDKFDMSHPQFESIRHAREYFERPLAWHASHYGDDPIGELATAARNTRNVQITPSEEDTFAYYDPIGADRQKVSTETSDFPGHPLLLRAGLSMNTKQQTPYYGLEYRSGLDHFFDRYYLGYIIAMKDGEVQEPEYTLIHESGRVITTNLTRVHPTERFEDFREDRFIGKTPEEYQLITIAADESDVFGIDIEPSSFDASLLDAPDTDDRALQLDKRLSPGADFDTRVFALTEDEFDDVKRQIQRLRDVATLNPQPAPTTGLQTVTGTTLLRGADAIACTNCESGQTRALGELTRQRIITLVGMPITAIKTQTTHVCRKCLRTVEIPTPDKHETPTNTDEQQGTNGELDSSDEAPGTHESPTLGLFDSEDSTDTTNSTSPETTDDNGTETDN